MQELYQQISTARRIAQESLNLRHGSIVKLPTFGRFATLAAARFPDAVLIRRHRYIPSCLAVPLQKEQKVRALCHARSSESGQFPTIHLHLAP